MPKPTLIKSDSPRQTIKSKEFIPGIPPPILTLKSAEIVDVWADNLEDEFSKISDLIEAGYNVVAVDTEFPGIVKNPNFECKDSQEFEYCLIKENVDSLNLIQFGISLATKDGIVPKNSPFTWQFNFYFDLNKEEFNHDAIDLLKRSGIDFEKNKEMGIDHFNFAELAFGSGLFLNENVKWISFHGSFDFSYLLKILSNDILPTSHSSFTSTMKYYFPNVYDLKYLVREFEHYKNEGLNRLAKAINVERIGPMHQAGSDALITLSCYFKLREQIFIGEPDILEKGHNVIFGIGKGHNNNSTYLNSYTFNSESSIYQKDNMMFNYYGNSFHAPPYTVPTDYRMMMWI